MIQKITAEEVYASLAKKNDIVLIDVRSNEEYLRNHIESSIHIPIEAIGEKINSTVPDKSKTIYLYCFSGSRSDLAADILQQMGYTHVFSMISGLLAWRSKQHPLISHT